MKTHTLLLLSAMLLSACGPKKIDASSEEKMKNSIEQVRAAVPEKERPKFDAALATVATGQLDFQDVMAGRSHAWEEKVKATLNGKTAAEVIAAGQAITEARRAKERKEAAISVSRARSEERRVGKECRLGWARSR